MSSTRSAPTAWATSDTTWTTPAADPCASLWVVEGRSAFGGGVNSGARDAALTMLVPASGGARVTVGIGTALETQAKKIAETLASQYAVTYAAPRLNARDLAVSVKIKDAKVMAPTWIAR